MELVDFKKEYSILQKKYKLPSFSDLNENFEIDKFDKDGDCILRVVRKMMMEKIVNSLAIFELFLNPVSAPRIYMPYIKGMTVEDKNMIEKMYDNFAALSLNSLDLEIDYSEKREAEVIKQVYSSWIASKPDFRKIIDGIKKPVLNSVRKEKSYYG